MFVISYKYFIITHNTVKDSLAKKGSKRKSIYRKQKAIDERKEKMESTLWDKLDIQDPLDVQDRTIVIAKRKIDWENITADLQDTANNTSQFVKLINAHLKDKKSQINKIVKLAHNFEDEIEQLKLDDEKISKLSDAPSDVFKSEKLRKLAQDLLIEREKKREILLKLKSDILKAEDELYKSNQRIETVNEKILENELELKSAKPKKNKAELAYSKF